MKQSNALAYLRQLCCLGLDKEMVMPEFLNSVTNVIPSNSNAFSGVDPQVFKPSDFILGFVDDGMTDTIQSIMPSYWIPERTMRVAAWFKTHPVLTDFSVFDESLNQSDFFNLIMRPLDQHHPLLAFIMNSDKPSGAINLFRSRSQKPFTKNEQTLFIRLIPYFSHAMQTQRQDDTQYCGNGVSGMMVMDIKGEILFQSETAKRLLMLASYPLMSMDVFSKENGVIQKLTQLCHNLEAIFQGKNATPPSWSHTNSCGRFIFRAYWLDKQNREPGGLIGMTIEHQEPLVLKLVCAMRTLPLSPTQKEVALLLAQGLSSENIGRRLHIKLTTVNDHVRKIFTKLDIHQREELLPKLLAEDNSIKKV